ncbi:MAG: restriction endonuclease subunit S [Spirochaetia bacterium]|nr:restriction endonuclease subunit S [Spirochaetia bacterium]
MLKYKHHPVGQLCSIIKGETGLASALPGNYPLVTTGADRKSCKTYQFDTEAVCIPLVSSTGHGKKSLNYVHYQSGKFALGTILAALIPREPQKLSAAFLHRYLQFYKDRKIVPLMKGAANVSLAVKDIAKIEIPVPPINEQKSFIELFNKLSDSSYKLLNEFSNQTTYLSQLRQAILQEAIEGKLTAEWRKKNLVNHEYTQMHTNKKKDISVHSSSFVVDDLDFAPASVLLEKIKAEKQRLIEEGKIRKEKPLAPIKPEEIPFELPEGWIWCRLPQILDTGDSLRRGPFGSSITKSMFIPKSQHSTKVYEQKNAIYKDYSIGSYYINIDIHKNLKYFLTGPGDIIISCAGTIGETYILPSEAPKGIINQALLKIRLNNKIVCNQFFLKVFKSQTKARLNNDARGTAMKNISSVVYLKNELVFPLPPLAEQRAIVERVDRLLSMVDDLEKQVTERKGQAAELMQTVLREAFETGK